MNASAKRMLLMRSNNNRDRNSDYNRRDYPGNRFRDDRGREHYDNGRYAPMRSEYPPDVWAEHRRGYGEYNDRGRTRNEYDDRRYREEQEPMGLIGFTMDGRPQEHRQDYPMDAGYYNMDEMEHRDSRQMQRGYAEGIGQRLSRNEAMTWAREMENEDGSRGPHWTMEQAKQVMAQKGVECDPLEFWLALNATYSDLCNVFKKHGVNTIDAYVDAAKAFWLNDKDSVPNKLAAYYTFIVKH